MRRSGVEIEESRVVGVQTLELHLAVAAAQIECLFVIEFKHFVTGNDATFAAHIEDTHLTAGQEIRSF